MADETRHAILADTSSLVALANTDLWEAVASSLELTTTNVCRHELRTHAESSSYPPAGSRDHYLKNGSQRILDVLDDAGSNVSCVTVVPRPHGPDAGEESLERELSTHHDAYQVVSLLDSAARRSIRRTVDENEFDIDVVGPPYLLYVLLDNDLVSRTEFCEATGEMLRAEGWTGYEVVKSAWANIPVDCTDLLGDDYDDVLPP